MGHGFYGSRFFTWRKSGNRNDSGRILLRSCSRVGPKKTGTYYHLKVENFHEYLLIAVNVKYIHSNPAVFSLKACAGKYGRYVSVLKFTINQPVSYLMQEIYKRHPDMAAFSCYIWNRTLPDQLIPDLHKVLPDTDIRAGRPEVSYDTDEVLQKRKLRSIMTGTGEATFYHLHAAYASGKQEILRAVLGGADTKRFLVQLLPFFH